MSETAERRTPDAGPGTPQQTARQRWMGLLARAAQTPVEAFWDALPKQPDYEILRAPESGLVMARGRAGGTGREFNLGEVSLTRCSVLLKTGFTGHGYVAGRKPRQAELAALIDAMMLEGTLRSEIETGLLRPLEQAEAEQRRQAGRKAAATKVDFFTMVRGED